MPTRRPTEIAKYTGHQFDEIEVVEVKRSGKIHSAFMVAASEAPVVFTKPGTYELPDKKQKTAFAQGTIYFRHGSKSEHSNRNDLVSWKDREIIKARKSWLGGIRKVVETNPDETVTVISSPLMSQKYDSIVQAAISSDPSALRVTPTNTGEIWRAKNTKRKRTDSACVAPRHWLPECFSIDLNSFDAPTTQFDQTQSPVSFSRKWE